MNCSSLQSFRSSDVHRSQQHHDVLQVQHSPSAELPHTHVTHHVTPIVRTHVHQQPPVEVVRTTKTVYQPPTIVHRTVDFDHHDHVATHYPSSTRSRVHTDYYPGQVTRSHTQSVDDKALAHRKAIEVHHDEIPRGQRIPQPHHDSHAHFGRVPTGNAVVTSYFNFPGSGRSDNAFQAPAPSRKVDYKPARAHHSPAYSPLQAQSIEDVDDDDDKDNDKPRVPPPSRVSPGAYRPRPPIYERISPPPDAHRIAHVPYYTGQASESKRPTVFPPPPATRTSDTVLPQRYPTSPVISTRKRPEPLRLKEKESDPREDDSRDTTDGDDDNNNNNTGSQGKNPVFLKTAPGRTPYSPEGFNWQGVPEFSRPSEQRPSSPLSGQNRQDPNKPSHDRRDGPEARDPSKSAAEAASRPPFGREQNRHEQDLRSATQEYPDFARPSRYSIEQVPTASLRYNAA